MDEYHISDLPSRFIMTQHYQSSMEQPNLDNVEAKLYVARQKNHELAMEYFRNKYGSTAAYEQFAKQHNLGEIVNKAGLSAEENLRNHLEKKAREIQKQFYNEGMYPGDAQDQGQAEPQWVHKDRKKSSNNPWVKNSNSKQQKHGHHRDGTDVSKFVDSASQPKNKGNQFISEFKSYLQNKQKTKQQEVVTKNNTSLLNGNKTSGSIFEASKVNNRSNISAKQIEASPKKRCYEEQLAKKVFKDLIKQSKQSSKVQKLALIEYLVANKKILKVLGFSEAELNHQLMKQEQTKQQSQISLQQFTYFIMKVVGKEKQINELKQQKRQKYVPEGCMLSREVIFHFEKVFKQLDVHTDLIVKRLEYIDRLANDPMIKGYLNAPAVYESAIDKTISLRRIFERIEMERLFGSEQQQKIKEYISWNEFLDYFKAGANPRTLYDMVALVESLHKLETLGLIEVPEAVMNVIAESARDITSEMGYMNTLKLIEGIQNHPQFETEKYAEVRPESRLVNLPSETFQDVLRRVKETGPKFINLKQFMEYFSTKGRPIEQYQENKINQSRKNLSGVKIKFAQQHMKKQSSNIDGYDSDPQMYQSKFMIKNSPRKSARSTKKLENAASLIQSSKNDPGNRRQFKVTIPVPFSFDEREKQKSRLNQSASPQKQQPKPFKANPIPGKVLEEGLYNKMIEQQKKKIQQRRKSCMIVTLANEQPFSFVNRKTNKKSKEQRQQFVFKAKPIPWYCSVDLLTKKREAQIVRNQKIAKEAQENLAKAKLPPRMQRDFHQKQAKQALIEQQKAKRVESKPKVYREPPDFDRLHKQFEEALERKRKQNKTTKPQEFNFTNKSASRPKTGFPNKTQYEFSAQQTKIKGEDYKKVLQPKPTATSTVKFQQQVEKRRLEMEKKLKEQEQRRLSQQKRKKIDQQLRQKLLQATKNKQNKQKERKEDAVKEMKENEKNFQQWKKQCVQKGRSQPMLLERPLKRDEKIEKMKKLQQISDTLRSNGIKGKEHDAYFNKQQLLMLQDWQVLKDKIK